MVAHEWYLYSFHIHHGNRISCDEHSVLQFDCSEHWFILPLSFLRRAIICIRVRCEMFSPLSMLYTSLIGMLIAALDSTTGLNMHTWHDCNVCLMSSKFVLAIPLSEPVIFLMFKSGCLCIISSWSIIDYLDDRDIMHILKFGSVRVISSMSFNNSDSYVAGSLIVRIALLVPLLLGLTYIMLPYGEANLNAFWLTSPSINTIFFECVIVALKKKHLSILFGAWFLHLWRIRLSHSPNT